MPIRAGIIGIWDYHEQIFRFADGRLVLRGANGSGKTKALEVLVPFVLDGSIDARRLDPFSSQQRTMRSNLLFGEHKVGHGYCWLEFAKGEQTVTVGVGMRAQDRRSSVDRWFFVTDGVVGEDFRLLTDNRIPVTRGELQEQIGAGRVFERRVDHQAAVDRRLFGLGLERYKAMLELVLTLRRPQLAKDLDPDALSDVLSDGLRTVDHELLRTSAQAFDNLESAQRQLSELERAHDAVQDLLTHWRTYLRARAAQRVDQVEDKRGRLEKTEHDIREKQIHIERKAREASSAEERERHHRAEVKRLGAAISGLRQSAAYKNQHQLDDARRAERLAVSGMSRAEATLASARERCVQAAGDLAQAEQELRAAIESWSEHLTELRSLLRRMGLPAEQDRSLGAIRSDLVARAAGVDAALERLEVLEAADAELRRAEETLQRSIAELEKVERGLKAAQAALDEVLAQAEAELSAWYEQLPAEVAEVIGRSTLLARLPDLGDTVDLREMVRAALVPLRDRWVARRNELDGCLVDTEAAIQRLSEEIEAIRAQRQDAPPEPPTRTASRRDLLGGPLWRLVRFRDGVNEADQAGIEGALLASGLLDAWVTPDGLADGELREDTWLLAPEPVDGVSLRSILEPEPEAGVPAERIESILASVSLEQAEIAILPDGGFALGPLAGHHRPSQARYIGATARARHRAARIKQIECDLDELRTRIASFRVEREEAEAYLTQLQELPQALPSPLPARKARGALQRAQVVREQAQVRSREDAARRDRRAREREEARHAMRQVAAEHGLTDEPEALRGLRRHLQDATRVLQELERAHDRAGRRESSRDAAAVRDQRAQQELDQTSKAAEAASTEHQQVRARLVTIEANLGVEVKQILAKLEELEASLASEEDSSEQARELREDAEKAKVAFSAQQMTLEQSLPVQRQDLEQAEVALRPFQQADVQAVLQVAEGEEAFPVRLGRAVHGASFSEEQLKSTETRLSRRLETLDQDLGSRFHGVRSSLDGVTLVQVQDELGKHGLSAFGGRLGDRLRTARALMDQEEKKLFEDQLLGNLCGQMRERIEETRVLVKSMDTAMLARSLASRKSLGIAWRTIPDAPAERRELLELLQFEPRLLGPERLQRIRQLLSDEVQAARQERPDREYLEILIDALNYRRWHRFELTLHEPDGSKHRLSKARHSRLSGGEKAATLHLPLFAAAHAHFQAARSDCPRLVALDEAFAGIDDTGVPELLRLAHEFDLDFFLTGYDLWITEPFMPEVMHYDLVHDPMSRTVSAWPILWKGGATVEGHDADPENAPL